MTELPTNPPTLFTVGHSNHTEAVFLELLTRHEIGVLVDVRSQPFSRYSPQFNDRYLKATLSESGIRYLFMGDQLGGRPEGDEFFDEAGHALYYRMAESSTFLAGIERLERGVHDHRVAIMCSEENPEVCHRHLLVTRVIREHGIDIQHIRADGRLDSEEKVRPRHKQSLLFPELEQDSWKSLRSVLPKHQPPDSSES
jgi:uncharacterized protein (DUF488 family)